MPQGPALVINVSALQFGLLRLGHKVRKSIQIRNISQLSATWHLRESPVCLEERHEGVSWPCWPLGCHLPPQATSPRLRTKLGHLSCAFQSEPWGCERKAHLATVTWQSLQFSPPGSSSPQNVFPHPGSTGGSGSLFHHQMQNRAWVSPWSEQSALGSTQAAALGRGHVMFCWDPSGACARSGYCQQVAPGHRPVAQI